MYKYLQSEHKEFVISKQVLRCGTSIGANIEEAKHRQSTLDFVHKLSIAQKEAAETAYWIKLLTKGKYLNEKLSSSLLSDCEELQKMLAASIKTSKAKVEKKN